MPADYTFIILGPHQAHSAAVLPIWAENGRLHQRYLTGLQQLRGRVYLCDGAIRRHEVELDGRFKMDGDEDAWHLLLVDDADKIIGCARYMVYPKTVCFNSLRISRSILARDLQWAHKLRQAVEADLQLVRDRSILYVEIGGWALSEEWRRTKAALETAVGSYALGNLWGGAMGSCTATVRHESASILRRLGGSSFQSKGETLPVYFDPQYGCNMELLRFECRCPVSRFEPLIKQLTSKLERAQVITASSFSSLFVPPEIHVFDKRSPATAALQDHPLEQLIEAAATQVQRNAGMWTGISSVRRG